MSLQLDYFYGGEAEQTGFLAVCEGQQRQERRQHGEESLHTTGY